MKNYNSSPFSRMILMIIFLALTFIGYSKGNKVLVAPIADFSSSAVTTCLNSSVSFTDLSANSPTSWEWTFSPVEVTFEFGTTSNSQNPVVSFDSTKTYNVTLTVSNADGSNSITKSNYVVGYQSTPFFEGFTTSVPPVDWGGINPDGLETWNRILLPLPNGGPLGNPTHVARMDNYQYDAAGQIDELITPAFDLTTIANPSMIFYIGYAAYGVNNFERLHIEYSTNCGATFNPTTYDKEHLSLATTGYQTSGWAPGNAGEWRLETIDLTPYVSTQTIFKFIQTCGYGNGLFIEDVRIENQALPVNMTYFEVDLNSNISHLRWQTASEINNEGFFVEKSIDGITWRQIGFVSGKETTVELSDYEYYDNDLFRGINYYRLKQVDFDGNYDFSNIRSVHFNGFDSNVSVFPNPTNDNFINIQSPFEESEIFIYDIDGRLKHQSSIQKGRNIISIQSFSSGVHFVKCNSEGKSDIERLIIQK